MSEDLAARFRREAEDWLAEDPQLPHSWSGDAASARLELPKTRDDGFDISVTVTGQVLFIETDRGWHLNETEVTWEDIERWMGVVRDMLSTRMRIRERCAGGAPYHWALETRVEESWHGEGSTTLLFWNYFGKRSERIYQNDTLPARLLPPQ